MASTLIPSSINSRQILPPNRPKPMTANSLFLISIPPSLPIRRFAMEKATDIVCSDPLHFMKHETYDYKFKFLFN